MSMADKDRVDKSKQSQNTPTGGAGGRAKHVADLKAQVAEVTTPPSLQHKVSGDQTSNTDAQAFNLNKEWDGICSDAKREGA